MKVMILGHGAVGSVLVKLLSKEKSVSSIVCGDISFAGEKKSGKVHFQKIDIKNENELLKFFNDERPDVVVNTVTPHFNLHILSICLKAKVNYLDTASFWELDPNPRALVPYEMEQMRYNKRFRDNKLLGLIESGVAPGLTNLISAECASQLDEIDYLKIRMAEDTGSDKIFFSWNKDWLLDELATKPLIYEKGKFKIVESFGAEEEFEFPKPIGKKKTYYFAQDEVGSIPLYVKTKKLDVKIHDNNIEASRLLVSLGLTSKKDIEINGTKIKPISFLSKMLPDTKPGDEKKFPNSVFAISIEAIGKKSGKKKTIKYSVVFPNQREIGKMRLNANFISYPTALLAKMFILSMPKIKNRGVFPPETLDKEIRKSILAELSRNKSILIKKEYK